MIRRPLFFFFVFCILIAFHSFSVPISANWKNNLKIGIVYKLKKPFIYIIENTWAKKTRIFPKGTKVYVSRRWIQDHLIYGNTKPVSLGINSVEGACKDDPGYSEFIIPYAEKNDYLEEISEESPLAHWQVGNADELKHGVPNIKANYYYNYNFPINVYPAIEHSLERIRLIEGSEPFRIVKSSPFCLEDEITIRYYGNDNENKKKKQPLYQGAGYFELASSHLDMDFCLKAMDFFKDEPRYWKRIPSDAKDKISWDEVSSKFYKQLYDIDSSIEPQWVDTFSNKDHAAGRAGPEIRLYQTSQLPLGLRSKLPENGWLAQYAGPLYYQCAGGICRAQGYQISISPDGTVSNFVKNGLYFWNGHAELLLTTKDGERLLKAVNNPTLLKSAYSKIGSSNYVASMSQVYGQTDRQAGNTYGTFLVHVSKIRAVIGLSNWPLHQGPAPGGVH